jgi:integrase
MLDLWDELDLPDKGADNAMNYRTAIRHWLKPYLGSRPAHDIKPSELVVVYRAAIDAGRGYSQIKKIRTAASAAFVWAVDDGRIAGERPGSGWNPARKSRLPENTPKPKSRNAPTTEDVQRLLSQTDPIGNGAYWRTCAECALRPSETAGLRWSDIDFEGGYVIVRGALRKPRGQSHWMWTPDAKNGDEGIRRIPIRPLLVEALHRQHLWVSQLRMASLWESDLWASELVFRKPKDGLGFDRWYVQSVTKRKADKAGVRIAPYQLRHYAPTRLAEQGVAPHVIAELLGIDLETARTYYIDRPEVAIDRALLESVF